jgi:hypothetical protein
MKTYAPSSETNRCAVARPMPLLPPVMTATLPSSFFMICLLMLVGFKFVSVERIDSKFPTLSILDILDPFQVLYHMIYITSTGVLEMDKRIRLGAKM